MLKVKIFRMERFEFLTTFPQTNNLDLKEIYEALGAIIVDKSAHRLHRSDARKAMAVVRNISRNVSEPSKLYVLLALSAFSIGKKIKDKIIFYTAQIEYCVRIQSHNFFRQAEMELDFNRMTLQNCFHQSPRKRFKPTRRPR